VAALPSSRQRAAAVPASRTRPWHHIGEPAGRQADRRASARSWTTAGPGTSASASWARSSGSSATRWLPGTRSSPAGGSDPPRWSPTPVTRGWTPCPQPGRWRAW